MPTGRQILRLVFQPQKNSMLMQLVQMEELKMLKTTSLTCTMQRLHRSLRSSGSVSMFLSNPVGLSKHFFPLTEIGLYGSAGSDQPSAVFLQRLQPQLQGLRSGMWHHRHHQTPCDVVRRQFLRPSPGITQSITRRGSSKVANSTDMPGQILLYCGCC